MVLNKYVIHGWQMIRYMWMWHYYLGWKYENDIPTLYFKMLKKIWKSSLHVSVLPTLAYVNT